MISRIILPPASIPPLVVAVFFAIAAIKTEYPWFILSLLLSVLLSLVFCGSLVRRQRRK